MERELQGAADGAVPGRAVDTGRAGRGGCEGDHAGAQSLPTQSVRLRNNQRTSYNSLPINTIWARRSIKTKNVTTMLTGCPCTASGHYLQISGDVRGYLVGEPPLLAHQSEEQVLVHC